MAPIQTMIRMLGKNLAPKTIESLIEHEESVALNAWTNARNSRLGWVFDLEPRLRRISAPLISQGTAREHKYHEIRPDHREPKFQISAFTNRSYPQKPDNSGKLKIVAEEPASIVFSLHPNGSVAVLLYSHTSGWGSFGRDPCYIVGVYRSTNELAGPAGDAIIRSHIKLFLRLASLSQAVAIPGKSSARLLEKLETATNRYSRIYNSKSDQRRAIVESELALGAGLAAGLVASTLFPMAQSMGKDLAIRVQDIGIRCRAPGGQATSAYEKCLSDRNYHFQSFVANAFSTEMLMMIAGITTALVAGIMWRRLRSSIH